MSPTLRKQNSSPLTCLPLIINSDATPRSPRKSSSLGLHPQGSSKQPSVDFDAAVGQLLLMPGYESPKAVDRARRLSMSTQSQRSLTTPDNLQVGGGSSPRELSPLPMSPRQQQQQGGGRVINLAFPQSDRRSLDAPPRWPAGYQQQARDSEQHRSSFDSSRQQSARPLLLEPFSLSERSPVPPSVPLSPLQKRRPSNLQVRVQNSSDPLLL